MSSRQKSICLITPGHIASNPRIVKEADALTEAGYRVHLVAVTSPSFVRDLDKTIYDSAAWSHSQVDLSSAARTVEVVKQKFCSVLSRHSPRLAKRYAVTAHSSTTGLLMKKVSGIRADLYVAHYLAALPVAIKAAARYRSKVGFDAEDFHTGELECTPQNEMEIRRRAAIEEAYLPRCDYLTASSPCIAQAYEKKYGVPVTSVLNVFDVGGRNGPLRNRSQRQQKGSKKSIYWFSQTLSPDRGLDLAVRALAHMQTNASLCLRGTPTAEGERQLRLLAQRYDVLDRVEFLEPRPPGEMVCLASNHDVGLSLENDRPRNRDICLVNKIFTYLSAGIPVVMTRTTSQTSLARELGEAARTVDLGDVRQCAHALDELLGDDVRLSEAKQSAFRIAKERFNWSIEKKNLLDVVAKVLDGRPPQDSCNLSGLTGAARVI